jgi:hypothetical protein
MLGMVAFHHQHLEELAATLGEASQLLLLGRGRGGGRRWERRAVSGQHGGIDGIGLGFKTSAAPALKARPNCSARSWSAAALRRFTSPALRWKSGGGPPHSKTLPRHSLNPKQFPTTVFQRREKFGLAQVPPGRLNRQRAGMGTTLVVMNFSRPVGTDFVLRGTRR